MERACRHIFNIRQQYSSLRLLREKIEEDELILHCDFSENYSCKYASEIQSMHFGASKRQISLHTGIAYCGQEKIPFCSVSDSLKHGPAAIWAHLDPVIMYMKSERSVIKGLHFITDGPTTQYRNKQNFYMWSKKVADFGFTRSTWNFLEAGHGKGAADSVKRSADNQVNIKAKDITNAKDFLLCMADTISKVKFFEVSEENITSMEAQLPGNLLPIPNTMKIHQLVFHGVGLFSSRYVSCFCSFPEDLMCKCFQPTKITICTTKQSISSLKGKQQSEGELNENNLKLQTEKANLDMNLDRIYDLDESLVSRYCVVSYDNKPYPGVITAVDDEEIEVKVMHSIGKNRFFWPRMEDVLWYKQNKIITLLQNQTKQVTNRHMKLDDDVWKLIEEELDL